MKMLLTLVIFTALTSNVYSSESASLDSNQQKSYRGWSLDGPCAKLEYAYNNMHNVQLAFGGYSTGTLFDHFSYITGGGQFSWNRANFILAPTLNFEYCDLRDRSLLLHGECSSGLQQILNSTN